MNHIDRTLGWIYFRHTLMAPATIFMLLLVAFASWLYYGVFNANPPKVIYWAIGIPFYFFDIIYNIVCGTFIFLELPRELIYTSRVARHKDSPYAGTSQFATFVCQVLDYFDPGHCGKV